MGRISIKEANQQINERKEDLFNCIKEQNLKVDLRKIKQTLNFAIKIHKNQVRLSGEPYIIHPIAVAKLMVEIHADTKSITLALLHDSVEDTNCTLQDIKKHFSTEEAELVKGVTKLKKIEVPGEKANQAENLRR